VTAGPSGPTGRPPVAIVAAVASNGVIGRQGALPWRLPADLKHFRTLTTGHAIVMGRRTFESLPGALPGRQNIVVTSNGAYVAPGAETAASLDAALARVVLPAPAYCIGGAALYRAALAIADTLHLTEIERSFEGDVRFPDRDRADWTEVSRERHVDEASGLAYAFVRYTRVRAG